MPEAMRGASSMSPDSVVSATGAALARRAQRCRPAADAAGRAFLDQRVPLAAGVAFAGPALMHRAAVLADELDAGLSHGCDWQQEVPEKLRGQGRGKKSRSRKLYSYRSGSDAPRRGRRSA